MINCSYGQKHFQWLTKDIGTPHLKVHLQRVIILMRISPNWNIFLRHLNRAFPGDRMELNLPESQEEANKSYVVQMNIRLLVIAFGCMDVFKYIWSSHFILYLQLK